MSKKKRVMITVDAAQWDTLQAELKERGYPANSMSVYLGYCLDELDSYLSGDGPASIPAVHQLEIHKHGLEEGLKAIGFTIVKTDERSSDS